MEQYRSNSNSEMTKTASGVDGFTNIGLVGNVNLKGSEGWRKSIYITLLLSLNVYITYVVKRIKISQYIYIRIDIVI